MKVKWYNMRQEPVIYINGQPYASRDPDNRHINIEIEDGDPEMLDNLQRAFTQIIQMRVDEDPEMEVKIHRDTSYVENPMERVDVEESVEDPHNRSPASVQTIKLSKAGVETIKVSKAGVETRKLSKGGVDTIKVSKLMDRKEKSVREELQRRLSASSVRSKKKTRGCKSCFLFDD